MLYCQPAPDQLPDPESCLLTGITPQTCLERGVPEHQFAEQVLAALGEPGTVGVGYNTIRFDDEVTRHLFWRNLIDPYGREWQNACGRWDLLDVLRCAYALRPEGIEWPCHPDGRPSFRLEQLTAAVGVAAVHLREVHVGVDEAGEDECVPVIHHGGVREGWGKVRPVAAPLDLAGIVNGQAADLKLHQRILRIQHERGARDVEDVPPMDCRHLDTSMIGVTGAGTAARTLATPPFQRRAGERVAVAHGRVVQLILLGEDPAPTSSAVS